VTLRADIAVRAEGVGKKYRLGQLDTGYRLLSEVISDRLRRLGSGRGRRAEFWALQDIGFEVERGETFGIIGHNGAGKSTLLKLLARVTPPTAGEIRLHGRVGALLEVGTGFHAELTGRENIYLNGAVLGMRRAEIARKFDEIVAFAEVEQFIDTPVKRYSSGMYLRLAFSVAAHLEPEILIVDEVLSVGDLAFQEKCLGRMETVAGEGRTVLFVSHNLTAVQTLCPRSMLLSRGRKLIEGPTGKVIEEYVSGIRSHTAISLNDRSDREGTGRFKFTSISFENDAGAVDVPITGEDLEVVLTYESSDGNAIRNAGFAIGVYSVLGNLILQLQSDVAGALHRSIPPSGEIRCRIPRLPLPAGRYVLNLMGTSGGTPADWIQRAGELTVAEGDYFGSGRRLPDSHQTVLVEQSWSVLSADESTDRARVPLAKD
jgi:homopolymeric O-antigen transport system ATP-binding protein